MLKFHQVSHLNKAQSIRNFWRRLCRDPEHEGSVQIEPAIPRQSNLFEQMVHPVEPRCTIGQAQRWFIKATPLQCFRDLCLTLLCGATSEGSVVQSRAAVQEMHCATSQDYLLWISGMQKSSQWQALTTLTHVIGSTYYIPYSLIYIYLPFPRPLYAGVYAGVFVGRQVAQQC